MTILDQIIAHKRREVAVKRKDVPAQLLRDSEFFHSPRKSFVGALSHSNKFAIIAEFKRRSPSKGWLYENADAAEITAGYETAGAAALSVLTDSEFFGGSNADLLDAFLRVEIPILRKDFIVDKYQIVEARSICASAILLIAAALEKNKIEDFAHFARELNLEVLLEIHDENEIPSNLNNISAIGVNNRNLQDFTVDVDRSVKIASKLPIEIVKISESGLKDAATILKLKQAGFNGFLIGETFMKTDNPAVACAKLIDELKS